MKKIYALVGLALFFCAGAGAKNFNETISPDGKKVAYTKEDNNLYVKDVRSGKECRLTDDGSEVILNGYASWVYYEEIFGRPSNYKAFWWSPDSKKLSFYRFDNSEVEMFPIYSPFGQQGRLNRTRYPKAGQKNPDVKVGIISLEDNSLCWADFDYAPDQYFGTPFWGDDSKRLFVQWMPRVQQELRLYAVDAVDGSLQTVYSEKYHTWAGWLSDMLFSSKGLYMARDFESGWQQIYFLSYDGKEFRRLTDGQNWRIELLKLDEKRGDLYFKSYRDSDIHACLYKVDAKGVITLLSDKDLNAGQVKIADDFRSFSVECSDINTPPVLYKYSLHKGRFVLKSTLPSNTAAPEDRPHWEIRYMEMEDGLKVPAAVSLPKGFDASKKYPVVMEIYGGPNTAYVRDYWTLRSYSDRVMWYYNHGIIRVIADTRAAGHNGRAGVDLIYRDLVSVPVADCLTWAKYLGSLDYVDASRIGVEGFSFGGTMTSMLVMNYPQYFKCGVAGGGVYDWTLYDSHYTERFMDTPQNNPDGYNRACVLNYVENYDDTRSTLKLTHGTGDDNVHFQNTLQLVDALQKADKQFLLMIYPDGMHGYRDYQGKHDFHADCEFWTEQFNL